MLNKKKKIVDTIKNQNDFQISAEYDEYISEDFGDIEYDLLEKFVNGADFGLISNKRKQKNIKNIASGIGDVVGIYKNPNSDSVEDNLVIYYDSKKDSIWFLTYAEFTYYPKSEWDKTSEERDKSGDFSLEKLVLYKEHDLNKALSQLSKDQKAKLEELAEDYGVEFKNLVFEIMDYANDNPIVQNGKKVVSIQVGYDWLIAQDFDNNLLGISPRGGKLKPQPASERQFEREYTNEQLNARIKRGFSLPFEVNVLEKELGPEKVAEFKQMAEEINEDYDDLLLEYARYKGSKNAPIETTKAASGRVTLGAYNYVKENYKKPGFIKDSKQKDEKRWFYGIKGVEFIWHGVTADPEVKYKGKLYNYYELEDTLYEIFEETSEEYGQDIDEDDAFRAWIKKNSNEVFEILEELTPKEIKIGDAFTEESSQGYKIIKTYRSIDGRIYNVAYREIYNDYLIGAGYDISNGYWVSGSVGYNDLKSAISTLFMKYGDEGLKEINIKKIKPRDSVIKESSEKEIADAFKARYEKH